MKVTFLTLFISIRVIPVTFSDAYLKYSQRLADVVMDTITIAHSHAERHKIQLCLTLLG